MSPTAINKVGGQRNRLLAAALRMTRQGRAIASPAPRTVRPKSSVEPTTIRSPLIAKRAQTGAPRITKPRITEIALITNQQPAEYSWGIGGAHLEPAPMP